MKMLKQGLFFISLALILLCSTITPAQTTDAASNTVNTQAAAANTDVEMADLLRQDGKIYIVVACVLVVLIGMIIYLVSIDKKVGQLEKQNRS